MRYETQPNSIAQLKWWIFSLHTHTLTLTHDNGGATSCYVTISQPEVLAVSAIENSPVVCNGEATGSATGTVPGGNAPDSY